MIVKREESVNRLVRLMGNGNVKVITGIRRCGKSFLLDRLLRRRLVDDGLAPNRIVSVSLELKKNERLRSPDALHEYLSGQLARIRGRAVVFVDELQMALPERTNTEERKRAEVAIYSSLNELKARPHTDVFVTGSNSSFLSDDVATMFRGRADTVRVCPFTFAEYLSAVRKNELAAWKDYMVYGGMPESLAYQEENDRKDYLQRLFRTVYFKDILERNAPLADEVVLENLSVFVMSAVGSLTNPSKLTNAMKTVLGVKTDYQVVRRHLGYLMSAYLIEEAKRWDVKGRHYMDYPSKYYSVDVGLRNARLDYRQQEPTHIMENIVFSELRARGYSVDVGMVEIESRKNGNREKRQHEVDFVVNFPGERVYIQSAYAMETEGKRNQEILPLRKTGDSFRKIVVTGDYQDPWKDESGVMYVGVIPFLLDKELVSK
jgi:hypothetical protein